MKIWVLFSIANNYDQPDNNLEAWWVNKPSIKQLAEAIGINVDLKKGSPELGKILKGMEIRIRSIDSDYRLEEINEGKYVKNI